MQRITAENRAARKPAPPKMPPAVPQQRLAESKPQWRNTELQTLQAASAITAVSVASLYRAQSEGRLVFRRLEGRTLVTTESLAAFVDGAPTWTAATQGRTAHEANAARRQRAA